MGLAEVNITPLPLTLPTAKRLISRTCHASWDGTLVNTLRITSMGQYRTNSSPQPWVRKTSRVLDDALTRLRLGHTRLGAHLHRQRLVPDPHCPGAGPSRTPLSTCCCTAHATTPSECCSDTNFAPWTCPPSTCPLCRTTPRRRTELMDSLVHPSPHLPSWPLSVVSGEPCCPPGGSCKTSRLLTSRAVLQWRLQGQAAP
ncbi:uncharacterized protein LOC127001977 isoform X5 [Eriocheir sinensis]|uniref:uncharacterized protein LOC127001977 isoform X5 n=1 Tax=Eriocheir sinensis TaxID=95602 RepID=UPI0021C63420|nr:uncharacterized protein LOC127001977 isoform X5 [Eriocheir sinensis]